MDLEQLLPKPKVYSSGANSNAAQLIFKDRHPYFMNPADRDRKITGVRRWEQAFRVYAAIYSNANPLRSAEIWQYVYIINKAASSFIWSNVSEYDYIFHQMMETNPKRNWGKTYSQIWNLCMTDPIQRQSMNHNNQQHHGNFSGRTNMNTSVTNKKQHKSDYCWKFNKGKCKFVADCQFVNKCSYCDSTAHGLVNCPKKNSAGQGNSNNGGSNAGNTGNMETKGIIYQL